MSSFEALELKIAKVLRGGVVLAGSFLVIGIVMSFKMNADPFYIFQTYDEIPFIELLKIYYRTGQTGILFSITGLITLISLPLIRVILTTYLFLRQKEFMLALIAFTVLIGLVGSMALGIGH